MADVDRLLGDRLDQVVSAHHRRRLRRLGSGGALHDRSGARPAVDRPTRQGNAVRVLLDGEEALPAMVEAITRARSHVHIAGWHASPGFRPTRGADERTLRDILADVAERVPVRMLMWAGPPLPVFQPTRGMAARAGAGFTTGTNVRCVLDARERTMHCHHEKIVVVDDEVAFVGGIDFTALQATATTAPPTSPTGRWAGTTWRPSCAGRSSRTSRRTSPSAGPRWRASRCPPPTCPRGRATSRCDSCGPCPATRPT